MNLKKTDHETFEIYYPPYFGIAFMPVRSRAIECASDARHYLC